MPLFPSAARTRVKWHHHALTASFGDASPARICRWKQDELPEGFTLRPVDGQMHLLQTGPEKEESTIAVFPSAIAAERALDLLSQNLLGPSGFGKIITRIFAVIGLLVILAFGGRIVWNAQNDYRLQHAAAQNMSGGAQPSRGAALPPAGIPGLTGSVPPAPPAAAQPVPGQPFDADQMYK